ncbi:MAG: amidase family protein [Myxococcota bacterium]
MNDVNLASDDLEARVRAQLAAIEARADLNAFVRLDRDGALAAARSPQPGPLKGMLVAAKDNLAIAGQPLTAGAPILEGFIAARDATCVARLRAAGAIFLGHTNLDAFGMGSTTELGCAGPAENPKARGRVTGGSSGGSAAAVAAGLVRGALGSDTGGSIRQPAAFCGVVGLKPTWGRVSRQGLVAYASSLDTVGPLATNVRDAGRLLQAMAGPDRLDATASPRPTDDFVAACNAPIEGMTVGRPALSCDIDDRVADAVDRAARRLEASGARIIDVALPHAKYALSTYMVISTAEASSNLARYDGVRYGRRAEAEHLRDLYVRSRDDGFGPQVQRRILLGTYVLSEGYVDAYFRKAAKVRTLIVRDYSSVFASTCDALLTPTTPEPAFERNSRTSDTLALYRTDEFTVGPSLAGLPAISVPAQQTQENLPIGIQLIAPWWHEAPLLAIAAALSNANTTYGG